MAVYRVVAQVGETTHEPAGERRAAVIEDLVERLVPVDQARLLRPERLTLLDRAPVEVLVCSHAGHLNCGT
ncbi:hypothetical protein D3C83_289180 [compost metagenome]